jgi:hypothetical protein
MQLVKRPEFPSPICSSVLLSGYASHGGYAPVMVEGDIACPLHSQVALGVSLTDVCADRCFSVELSLTQY